jgi:glycine betaine/proline transport system substrate-binding protein
VITKVINRKKWTILLLIVLMIVSVGCNAGDEKKEKDNDNNSDSPTVESTASSEPLAVENTPATNDERTVIRLILEPWDGSAINLEIARYILENEMGYKVEVVEATGETQFEAIASGQAHASLEVWPSGHLDTMKLYFEDNKTVIKGSELGVVGKIGWFVPSYVVRARPELATWEGYLNADNVLFFDTDATEGTKGQFVVGDPGWGHYEPQIFANRGMDFQVVYGDSEESMIEMLDQAYQADAPFLFYFWTPHWVFNTYDLQEVLLPPYNEECYADAPESVDCDYPADVIFKIYSTDLQTYAPDVYEFFENFYYTNQVQIAMMAEMRLEEKTAQEVAIEWVHNNEETWREWLPEE